MPEDHVRVSRPLHTSPLQMEDLASAGEHTLLLGGELDIVSAVELEARTRRLCAGEMTRLVIDMSGLTFIDSTGVKAIITSRQLCADHGQEFCLIRAAGHVHRIFEVTGLDKRLPFA